MSVDEFNRMVMDWEDEDAFHKTEEVFQRIFYSLKGRILWRTSYMAHFPIHGMNVSGSITGSARDRKIPGTAGKLFWRPMEMYLGTRSFSRQLCGLFL